jgi:hypothetical protein
MCSACPEEKAFLRLPENEMPWRCPTIVRRLLERRLQNYKELLVIAADQGLGRGIAERSRYSSADVSHRDVFAGITVIGKAPLGWLPIKLVRILDGGIARHKS